MTRVTARTARTRKRCTGYGCVIAPGDRYLEHVASPWHDDIGNDRWWRIAECADCATRYGRDGLLHPDTPRQVQDA